MEFKHEPQEYIKNLEEYMELDEVQFSSEQSKEEIITKLREISEKKREISKVQNQILEEYVERFEKGQEVPDDEAAGKLRAMMNTLYVREPAPQCYDAPVLLRLSRVLFDYYKKQDDLLYIAKMLFFGSLSEFFMNINLETFHFFTFPKLCEEYFPRMDEMSEEAKECMINAYYFRILTKDDEELLETMDVFPKIESTIHFYLEQLNYPEKFKNILCKLRLNFLSFATIMIRLDAERKKFDKPLIYHFDIEKYRGLITDCIEKIEGEMELLQNDPYLTGVTRMQIAILRFHLGLISFEELLKELDVFRLVEAEDPVSQLQMLTANTMYLNYIHACSPYSKDEDERLGRECIQNMLPKILEMKKQKMYMFAPMIVNFLGATSFYSLDFYDFYDIALEFTVYADKALYVHTVMVKEISHLILERILEERPEFIDGVNGWNIGYIKANKDEVLKLMDICAMCHDIGKHYIIDVVSNSSRSLTDDEFEMIKNHPQYFEEFYQKPEKEKEKISCIHDCAVLHHRWHNEQGGYPDMPHTVNRPFVDIIAIADSLDAATDYIGRPYGSGKTLDELLVEFKEMGGTRYSKEVAELINEPAVKAAIADTITKRREEVNYRIYAFHEIEGKSATLEN